MPLGPKRAPGRYEVPVSNGAPGAPASERSGAWGGAWGSAAGGVLTEEGDVVLLRVAAQAREVRQAAEGGDAREHGVGLAGASAARCGTAARSAWVPASRHRRAACCTTALGEGRRWALARGRCGRSRRPGPRSGRAWRASRRRWTDENAAEAREAPEAPEAPIRDRGVSRA